MTKNGVFIYHLFAYTFVDRYNRILHTITNYTLYNVHEYFKRGHFYGVHFNLLRINRVPYVVLHHLCLHDDEKPINTCKSSIAKLAYISSS